MNRTIPLRRRVLLGGLTIPVLVPIARARAQGSAAPPQPRKAPFGLTWGMSVESIPAFDTYYRDLVRSSEQDGTTLRLLPQLWHMLPVPHDTHSVDLYFGHRNRLFRVYAEAEPGQADAVMTRYKELSSLLSDLYGQGSETVAAQSWFRRDKPNSSLRYTSFITDEVQVKLSLLSGYDDKVYWVIVFQHRTGFAEFQADHIKSQRDAL